MEKPSKTARAAAIHRAAHQVLEMGRIFDDPLALRIVGEQAELREMQLWTCIVPAASAGEAG